MNADYRNASNLPIPNRDVRDRQTKRKRIFKMKTILVSMVMVIGLSNAANADTLFPSIAAKASSEFPGWPASHGIDASMTTCWSSGLHASVNNTEWYDIDLGGFKRVNYLKLEAYPVLPEANPDGSPAATITGVAYWLIHHIQNPVKWP